MISPSKVTLSRRKRRRTTSTHSLMAASGFRLLIPCFQARGSQYAPTPSTALPCEISSRVANVSAVREGTLVQMFITPVASFIFLVTEAKEPRTEIASRTSRVSQTHTVSNPFSSASFAISICSSVLGLSRKHNPIRTWELGTNRESEKRDLRIHSWWALDRICHSSVHLTFLRVGPSCQTRFSALHNRKLTEPKLFNRSILSRLAPLGRIPSSLHTRMSPLSCGIVYDAARRTSSVAVVRENRPLLQTRRGRVGPALRSIDFFPEFRDYLLTE